MIIDDSEDAAVPLGDRGQSVRKVGICAIFQREYGLVDHALDPIPMDLALLQDIQGVKTEG